VADPVTITEAAAAKFKLELAERIMDHPQSGIRVGVAGGGCSGFTYMLDVDIKGPKLRDTVFTTLGVPIFIDPVSAHYLKGTNIDWQKRGLAEGFVFDTPGSKTCGCGNSFSPD
jgi:iron-sulfur cluster assembly protein